MVNVGKIQNLDVSDVYAQKMKQVLQKIPQFWKAEENNFVSCLFSNY